MTFSQGWDTGFKAVLIFVGVVFVWLYLIEPLIPNRGLSVALMTIVAGGAAAAFFIRMRRRYMAERAAADAEIAALLATARREP